MNQLTNQTGQSGNEMEIDLLDLLGYYLNRLPFLIAALIIGALAAGLYTHFLVPDRYTATAKMYMVSASSDTVVNLSDLNLGTSLSNDYVELMKSRPVMEAVIEKLELDYSYGQLLSMISLSVINNTRIIAISATSQDPQEAMNIANQVARTAKTQLPEVMASPSPTIAENAVLPQARSSPSMKKNVLLGGLLALMIVLAILTVQYLLDDTIKTAEDVEREFGVLPLSVIPEGEIRGFGETGGNESRGSRKRRPFGTGGKKGGGE